MLSPDNTAQAEHCAVKLCPLKSNAAVQRHLIVGDVVRLLHLQEVCDDLAGQLAHNSSLSWRLSLAMELVASPTLLIIDGAHPSKPCSLLTHALVLELAYKSPVAL